VLYRCVGGVAWWGKGGDGGAAVEEIDKIMTKLSSEVKQHSLQSTPSKQWLSHGSFTSCVASNTAEGHVEMQRLAPNSPGAVKKRGDPPQWWAEAREVPVMSGKVWCKDGTRR
jgi:hypothetical protein